MVISIMILTCVTRQHGYFIILKYSICNFWMAGIRFSLIFLEGQVLKKVNFKQEKSTYKTAACTLAPTSMSLHLERLWCFILYLSILLNIKYFDTFNKYPLNKRYYWSYRRTQPFPLLPIDNLLWIIMIRSFPRIKTVRKV